MTVSRTGEDRRARPDCRTRALVPLLLSLVAAIAATADARQEGTTISLREFHRRLDAHLADSALRRSLVGLSVVRLADGSTVASRNASTLLHPGSNVKLLTAAAALATLPPDFSFRTSVWCGAAIDDGELKGDLVVRGGGDPLLDVPDVDSIAGMVEAAGIRRIDGGIVADLSLFDTLGWGRGWMWDDEPDPDGAFITPLSFNAASAVVIVGPGKGAGTPLDCRVEPVPGYFEIDNRSATVPRNAADSAVVTRSRGFDRIVVRGTMSLGSPPETVAVSVRHPALHFLHALREALAARGIVTGGGIRAGGSPAAVLLGSIGHGLEAALGRLNTQSDNLAAEALLKVLGSRATGLPGSAADGLAVVAAYLRGIGIDPAGVILADGSGVSWYNALAPADIVAVLRDQYGRASTFGAFYRSLARPGRDGTLSARLAGTPAAGRVAAKTGTLTGVSALSGYIATRSHDLLAFSIVVNHFPGKVARLRAIQDAILGDLALLDPDRQ